ncbi:MAG: hypothetical protein KAI82_16135, partial [Tritonibacter mobilis]|nr:hypothetical protein [Tritonibacter mobilis]
RGKRPCGVSHLGTRDWGLGTHLLRVYCCQESVSTGIIAHDKWRQRTTGFYTRLNKDHDPWQNLKHAHWPI